MLLPVKAQQCPTVVANACALRAVTAAGRGSFTAAIELRKQRQLVISFLYHMAVQRNVRNPFETQEVVGASRICQRICQQMLTPSMKS